MERHVGTATASLFGDEFNYMQYGYWKDAEGSNAMQGSEFLSFSSHSDGLSNSLRQF